MIYCCRYYHDLVRRVNNFVENVALVYTLKGKNGGTRGDVNGGLVVGVVFGGHRLVVRMDRMGGEREGGGGGGGARVVPSCFWFGGRRGEVYSCHAWT